MQSRSLEYKTFIHVLLPSHSELWGRSERKQAGVVAYAVHVNAV